MSYDESESLFGMEQYCPIHEDEDLDAEFSADLDDDFDED